MNMVFITAISVLMKKVIHGDLDELFIKYPHTHRLLLFTLLTNRILTNKRSVENYGKGYFSSF